MRNEIKSKFFYSNAIKVLLTFCVSVVCFFGMSVLHQAVAYLAGVKYYPDACQSWGKLPVATGLPENAVSYYMVQCRRVDGTYEKKYLKVVKETNGNLAVYSAGTMAAAKSTSSLDANFVGEYNVTGAAAPYVEEWRINLVEHTYSDIASMSPLTTTIQSNKVWDGKEGVNYIDVDDETVVEFTLRGASSKDFYVKKVDDSGKKKLQISSDNINYMDSLVYDDHTINAYLRPKEDNLGVSKAPEEWIITITGYEMRNASGEAISYKVLETDIESNGQHQWASQGTRIVHEWAGAATTTCNIVYTLQLSGVPRAENPAVGPFNILRFTKTVTDADVNDKIDGKVTKIKVEGLKGQVDTTTDPDSITFATVTDATGIGGGSAVKMPATSGSITFVSLGTGVRVADTLYIEDMTGKVVTVNIRTGVDNSLFTLDLSLDTDGKLAYHFKQLPLSTYLIDPYSSGHEDEIIADDSNPYKVVVTKSREDDPVNPVF